MRAIRAADLARLEHVLACTRPCVIKAFFAISIFNN
jgi:hypothetical protein